MEFEKNPYLGFFAVRFVRAVAVLALSADAQIAWLRSLFSGDPGLVDELALEFDDGLRLLPQFAAEGWFKAKCIEEIERLDALLNQFGPGNDLWLVHSLTEPEWDAVRQQASRVLIEIR